MRTLKELADIADVSISTVSKALNDSKDIGEETKQRILELADRYGYAKARKKTAVQSSDGPAIGVIYSDITSNYYSRLIEKFDNYIAGIGGLMIMSCARFENRQINKITRYFESSNTVDGIICISPFNVFGDISRSSLPMVGLSYPSFENHPFDYICVDDSIGIDEGIQSLKKQGHTKIAFLSEKFTDHRLQFFKHSMKKHNIPIDPALIRVSNNRFEQAGFEMMQDIFAKGSVPTAVFAAYDDIAVGAAGFLIDHGLKIPEDVSIAGIDNTMCTINGHNMLSSVNCHMEEQVDIAVNMLMKKINNPDFTVIQNVNLQTSFAERNTIGPARDS